MRLDSAVGKTFSLSKLTFLRDLQCHKSLCHYLFHHDLMPPFQNRYFYHPQLNGSYSIKNVLPSLVSGLTYDGLAISDGGLAKQAFVELSEEKDPDRISEIRSDLGEYCKLDALAVVKILRRLETL